MDMREGPAASAGGSFGEVGALARADGQAGALHDEEEVLPDHAFGLQGVVAEEVAGVVGDHERAALPRLPLAAQFADGGLGPEEALHGGRAEGDDDLGLDDLQLGAQRRLGMPGRLVEIPFVRFGDAVPTPAQLGGSPYLRDLLEVLS